MSPDFTDGLLWYIVFLYSTVCHEAAHAWTALKLGDDTAYRGGQVTLDPLPHIRREPIGMVVVPLISFLSAGWMIGWASAPYDPGWALRNPRRCAMMSLAGPAANMVIVMLAGLLLRAGVEWHLWEEPFSFAPAHLAEPMAAGLYPWVVKLLSIAFSLNLLLAVFNLLPLPPLDGSNLPLLFLPEGAAQKYLAFLWNPTMRFVGLLVAWQGFRYIFDPIRRIALHVLYPDAGPAL
ncbi:MAG: site-2 protease family protein [Chthoniobacter sp.]|uniref:site-2 protease family protein n=1 Tax=Chthoniobacter sp. TaxID=2510640 RepID=UPI0032A6E62F